MDLIHCSLFCRLLLLLLLQLETSTADSDIKQVAAATYARVIPCLRNRAAAVPDKFSWSALNFPDDAQEHYQQLLAQTLKYRTKIKPHSYANYAEPWLENMFIERFSSLPLRSFGGLIPLFVQVRFIGTPCAVRPMRHVARVSYLFPSLPLSVSLCYSAAHEHADCGRSHAAAPFMPLALVHLAVD